MDPPLLHVAQPGDRVAHMSRVSRSVCGLATYQGPIGLLVVALDHFPIGICFGDDGAKGVSVDVSDCFLACGDGRW